MKNHLQLKSAINNFLLIPEDDWKIIDSGILVKEVSKGDFFKEEGSICKYLGFVCKGLFRTYYYNGAEDLNIYFSFENDFLLSYQSFVTQAPCKLNIQAMENATILLIPYDSLQNAFINSHAWERFGRLLAEFVSVYLQKRTESLLFQTPEQRYLDLIKDYPQIFERLTLYHIASFLGIQGPSLSRIRSRLSKNRI